MSFSRRQFLKRGSGVLATAAIPASVLNAHGIHAHGIHAPGARAQRQTYGDATARANDTIARANDPELKALLQTALDAARAAGATYADVRHIVSIREGWGWNLGPYYPPSVDTEVGIGVRALYNGYWGYAAITVDAPTSDAVAQLGREATAQARTGAAGKPRDVTLAPLPSVANGTWTTPIEIDPFSVSWDEKQDVMNGFLRYLELQPFGGGASASFSFSKNVQTFASTDGAFYAQTLYHTRVGFPVAVAPHWRTERGGGRSADGFVSIAGAGWEYVLNAPFELEARRLLAQARDVTQAVPVEVGRYEIVFDGAALAKIADMHIGTATELDRATSYLANTVGTSYLNDPLAMLGTYKIGSPLLNVSANRSMPRGAATVKWDAEGVEPDEAMLVKDGILTDFQTTRESASWLKDYYAKAGMPLRSHGGAVCNDLRSGPQQGAPNLVVAPSPQDTSFEALCSGVKKGLAVLSGRSRPDQQALNGESAGDIVYEINNGKLGRVVDGAILITRSPEFWSNLIGLGGKQSVCAVGLDTRQRAGSDPTFHTASAPAGLVKQVAVTVNTARAL